MYTFAVILGGKALDFYSLSHGSTAMENVPQRSNSGIKRPIDQEIIRILADLKELYDNLAAELPLMLTELRSERGLNRKDHADAGTRG